MQLLEGVRNNVKNVAYFTTTNRRFAPFSRFVSIFFTFLTRFWLLCDDLTLDEKKVNFSFLCHHAAHVSLISSYF